MNDFVVSQLSRMIGVGLQKTRKSRIQLGDPPARRPASAPPELEDTFGAGAGLLLEPGAGSDPDGSRRFWWNDTRQVRRDSEARRAPPELSAGVEDAGGGGGRRREPRERRLRPRDERRAGLRVRHGLSGDEERLDRGERVRSDRGRRRGMGRRRIIRPNRGYNTPSRGWSLGNRPCAWLAGVVASVFKTDAFGRSAIPPRRR